MRDNSREAGWIFFSAVVLFRIIVIGIVIGSAMSKADAADADASLCKPEDEGIKRAIILAETSGSKLLTIPAPKMKDFIASLGDDGKGITGDNALVLLIPDGHSMILVGHDKELCLSKIIEHWPDLNKLMPSKAGDKDI